MRDYSAKKEAGSSSASEAVTESGPTLEEVLASRPQTGIMLFVINNMLDAMLNINPAYATGVRQWMTENLRGLKLVRGGNELSGWLRQQTRPPRIDFTNDDMQKIVNLLYVGACEYFGPNDADILLHETINKAEQLPAAKRFAPRELL